jgi:hypothetical protein
LTTTQNRRLNRDILASDQLALDAIRDLPGYQAFNPEFTLERLNELDASYRDAQQEERRTANAQAAARETLVIIARQRHDALFGAKRQVIAQYGPDSNAVQSLGLKKKSERRTPRRDPKSEA